MKIEVRIGDASVLLCTDMRADATAAEMAPFVKWVGEVLSEHAELAAGVALSGEPERFRFRIVLDPPLDLRPREAA